MAGLLRTQQTARRRWWLSLIFGSLLMVLLTIPTYHYRQSGGYGEVAAPVAPSHLGLEENVSTTLNGAVRELIKPTDMKVIALVFFGRKSRVQMLRCFLERNLVDHGGWLDEIHWVKNTDNPADLKYLDEILASQPTRYKEIILEGVGFIGYGYAWSHLEPGHIYVKIDDDVVWFADDTIPRIVTMKTRNPEYLLVSANVVNSPLMGWVHYHMGAMHPYLPEFMDADNIPAPPHGKVHHTPPPLPVRTSWKYVDYPAWTGPDDYFFGLQQDPPYANHRWLRLPQSPEDAATQLHRTPIAEIEYKTWGTGLESWAVAAQSHYSFLENLYNNNLDLYKFGEHSKPWISDYQRLSINFICFFSDEILSHLPMDTVDEEWLTVILPKKIGKSIAVDTNSLAAHFTFGTQGNVEMTDLLGRYWDYAEENACLKR